MKKLLVTVIVYRPEVLKGEIPIEQLSEDGTVLDPDDLEQALLENGAKWEKSERLGSFDFIHTCYPESNIAPGVIVPEDSMEEIATMIREVLDS